MACCNDVPSPSPGPEGDRRGGDGWLAPAAAGSGFGGCSSSRKYASEIGVGNFQKDPLMIFNSHESTKAPF